MLSGKYSFLIGKNATKKGHIVDVALAIILSQITNSLRGNFCISYRYRKGKVRYGQ